jgi:hypothetical protein
MNKKYKMYLKKYLKMEFCFVFEVKKLRGHQLINIVESFKNFENYYDNCQLWTPSKKPKKVGVLYFMK